MRFVLPAWWGTWQSCRTGVRSAPKTATIGVSIGQDARFRTNDRVALDRSRMPTRMPVVGYRGHLRGTKESSECYGTSHWRPSLPTNRLVAQAMAFEPAKSKAMTTFGIGLGADVTSLDQAQYEA